MRSLTGLAPIAVAVAGGIVIACASPGGGPPGGPPDSKAPEIIRVLPESAATGTRPPRVVFEFDEVVSERPSGAVSLNGLFLVSPRDGEPEVRWQRDVVTIRPRRGWRANTVYTITMLPGLQDLRNNVRRTGAMTTFSTGAQIPNTRLSGIAFDWLSGRGAAKAYVEATLRPDSVVYVTLADSAGRFTLPYLPPGEYSVRALLDANANRGLDPRELWDTVRVTLVDSAQVEILAFVHDTIGARIDEVLLADSASLRVTFDKPLDPAQEITTSNFLLLRSDSSRVGVLAVLSAAALDSVEALRALALRDSVRTTFSRDSAARAGRRRVDSIPALTPSRPPPVTALVLRLERPLLPDSTYRLRALDVRNLLGRARTSDRAFTVPKSMSEDSIPAVRPDTASRLAPPTPARPR